MSDSEPSPPLLPHEALPPNDALPPVEPPSAGFLIQLFLIPGLIVGIIVLVWVLFNWVAHGGANDPEAFLQNLRREDHSEVPWMTAENLAEALRNDPQLRGNGRLAAQVATILDERLAAGKSDEDSIKLRAYLCYALGEFSTPEGLPVLLKAATADSAKEPLQVREAAIDAIGTLELNMLLAKKAPLEHPDLIDTLLTLSHDPDPFIRSAAASPLGIIGADRADKHSIERLAQMLNDADRDVSYNAAIALTRSGDVRAMPMLIEMLSPDQTASLSKEAENVRDEKRRKINLSGLRWSKQLAQANPTADLRPLEAAVEAMLKQTEISMDVREAAKAADEALKEQAKSSAAARK